MLDFIRNFADGFHHAREETHLFPALEQIGIKNENGPLAFLRSEHTTERGLLSELEHAVGEYRRNPIAYDKFVSLALFRLAEEMLDDQMNWRKPGPFEHKRINCREKRRAKTISRLS